MHSNEYRASIYPLASHDRGMAGPVNVNANVMHGLTTRFERERTSPIVPNGTHPHRPEIFSLFQRRAVRQSNSRNDCFSVPDDQLLLRSHRHNRTYTTYTAHSLEVL